MDILAQRGVAFPRGMDLIPAHFHRAEGNLMFYRGVFDGQGIGGPELPVQGPVPVQQPVMEFNALQGVKDAHLLLYPGMADP